MERVRSLVSASFLLGLALVLFYGSANAIFLTRYDVSVLPWVYILNAITVIAVGLAYGAWSARVAVGRALVGLAVASTFTVAILWVWATVSNDRYVAFVLAMWFRLLFIFAVLGLWEIASAVFDIRQAKRLFAGIALGVMLGFVVGGAATPLLGTLIGTVNLVGLAALLFALYTLAFARLLRRYRIGARRDSAAVAPAGPVEILTDRYSRRMVWMRSVTILLAYLTEFVFYEQAAASFDTEESLAGFFGVFMGAMTVVMVLVTGLVSGRYIARFGIRSATLALPVAMLVVAAPAGLYGTAVGVDNVFFVLVCIALATQHIVGNAIGEPAGAVLFQPMAPVQRMRVRLAVDGWLGSIALLLSGVLLLALAAVDLGTVAPYLYAVAVIAAVGIAVAILQYRSYRDALRHATTLGFDGEVTGRFDPLDSAFIEEAVRSDDPGAVLATAGVLRSWAADPLKPVLPTLVEHSQADVVELALQAMAGDADPRDAPLVEFVLARDDLRPSTRSRALRLLSKLDSESADRHIRSLLAGTSADVALGAMLDDPERCSAGLDRLCELVASAHAVDRHRAAHVIEASFLDGAVTDSMVGALLRDADDSVVAAALAAAAGRLTTAMSGAAILLLSHPTHRRAAIQTLATVEPEMLASIEDALADLPDEVVAEVIVGVLGPRTDSATLVDRWLAPPGPSIVRRAAYRALGDDGHAVEIRGHLAADLELLNVVTSTHRAIAGTDGTLGAALRDAFREEFELGRGAVLAALGTEYGARRVRDIETLMRAGDDDDRANAIEALDVMLAADHRRAIVAVLEPTDVVEAARLATPLGLDTPVVVDQLRTDPRFTSWTRLLLTAFYDHNHGGPAMDPTIARVLALRRIDIFSTLSYESLAELAGLVRTHSASEGEVIIETGSMGEELYAIVSGDVEVVRDDGSLARLAEGTVFGELAILDPAPRSATVTAIGAVELLVVSRAVVLSLTDRRPTVMAEIARVLAHRLRAMS